MDGDAETRRDRDINVLITNAEHKHNTTTDTARCTAYATGHNTDNTVRNTTTSNTYRTHTVVPLLHSYEAPSTIGVNPITLHGEALA